MPRISDTIKHQIIILLFGLFQYGLILLMDGTYWDDWAILSMLEDKNWKLLHDYFSEVGLPMIGHFHRLFGYFSNISLSYHVFILISAPIFGCLIYQIATKWNFFSKPESLFLALLAISYPANKCDFLIITSPYIGCTNIFLAAAYILILTQNPKTKYLYFKKIFAAILFLLSFNTNSLLLFYWPFLSLALYVFLKSNKSILRFIKLNFIFIVLPFIYWIAKETFSPRQGRFEAYNKLIISTHSITKNTYRFIEYGILDPLTHYIPLPKHVLLIAFGTIVAFMSYSLLKKAKMTYFKNDFSKIIIGIFPFILLVLGILPYVLVGKSPQFENGWSTRHNLLLNLPIALLCLISAKLFLKWEGNKISNTGLTALLILLGWFSIQKFSNFMVWQARGVKDLSIMHNLHLDPSGKYYTVYWIEDNFKIINEPYRFYEWAAMFEKSWGEETRVGFSFGDTVSYREKQPNFGKIHNLSKFSVGGTHAKMSISAENNHLPPAEIAISYWKYKLFNSNKLDSFLNKLTEIKIEPMEPPL